MIFRAILPSLGMPVLTVRLAFKMDAPARLRFSVDYFGKNIVFHRPTLTLCENTPIVVSLVFRRFGDYSKSIEFFANWRRIARSHIHSKTVFIG